MFSRIQNKHLEYNISCVSFQRKGNLLQAELSSKFWFYMLHSISIAQEVIYVTSFTTGQNYSGFLWGFV